MSRLCALLLGFLLLLSANTFAQCPPNIGFENGSFDGWICSIGNIGSEGELSLSGRDPVSNRHTLYNSRETTDMYGHFSVLAPNGSKYSVRLGNDINGHQAEQLSYFFKVPPGKDYSLVFYCAVVLQNPSHSAVHQPKFTAHIYNVTDNKPIDCPYFDFVAGYNVPGFKLSDVLPPPDSTGRASADVYYKDWSATTINLAGYAGKTVRLDFTTNDCTLGGHFGYAYIDIDEECNQSITGNTYCAGQKSITLAAPVGFEQYTWFKDDLSHIVGAGKTLTLNPAPPDQSKYGVLITPYPGLGCLDTIYTTINKIDADFKLKVLDTVWGCRGAGADLTAASVTAGSTAGMTYSYFTDPVTATHVLNPKGVADPGVYYIKGTSPQGCTNIVPVQVMLHDQPVVTITDPPPVQFPRTVNLASVFAAKSGQTYLYYADATLTNRVTNLNVNVGGKYYIKSINDVGCETVTSVTVTINPPPPYSVTGPNVFTPNNDGINDYFTLKLDGFVKFGNVKIFNRYGQVVFTSKSENDFWDGNKNGRPLPPGTYYWIFEGTDQYYHTKVIKSSSITIAR